MPNLSIDIKVDRRQLERALKDIEQLKRAGWNMPNGDIFLGSSPRTNTAAAQLKDYQLMGAATKRVTANMQQWQTAAKKMRDELSQINKDIAGLEKASHGSMKASTRGVMLDEINQLQQRRSEVEKTLSRAETRAAGYQSRLSAGTPPETPHNPAGYAGGQNAMPWLRRAMGFGLAAAGIGSVGALIGSARASYRSAIEEESPLWARGIRGSRQRAGAAAGIGVGPSEWYALENSLSRGTGLNGAGLSRSAMLSATFAKSSGLDIADVAGLRGSLYSATGSNSRIPDAVLISMGEATKRGLEKARLPELLTMINRGTHATAAAMHGAGVSGSQIGAITALSIAALSLKEGTSYKQYAKSGEFGNVMQNGMQDAGSPAGNIMLFEALGGFNGPMNWEKVHTMNLVKQGGFLKRPDLLQNIIGGLSGSPGARAGQLETFFKSWGIDGAASDSLIQMHDFGFLKRLSKTKGKTIEQMASGGDVEAKRWLVMIAENPALGRQATEATKDFVKIEAGEQLSKLFQPLEMAAAKLTGALVDGNWQKSFSIMGKAAGEMGPVSKTLLASAGLFAAGGALSAIGGVTGLAGKAGGAALMSSILGPLAPVLMGGAAAYGIFNGGGDFLPTDKKSAITGKGPSAKYSDKWIPFKSEFDRAAKKYGLDPTLLYSMGRPESGFNPRAISHKGAGGVMQLMPGTAADLGVKNNFDPAQNIDGGAKYIYQLLKKYDGDTLKALAAYNWGPGNVDKHGVGNLPPETRKYISDVKTGQQGYFDSSQPTARSTDSSMQMIAEILKIIAGHSERTAANTGNRPLTPLAGSVN